MNVPFLLRQLMIRTGLILAVKVIGAVGRIPLFRLLGAEGTGLYQMAYSYYGVVLTLVSAGFSTAISLTTAKNARAGVKVLHFSTLLLVLVGSIAAICTYTFAPFIANLFGESKLIWPIRLLSPALVLVPLLSLIRGFLQGLEYYGVIAVSELIEQVIRVGTMLVLASIWLQYSLSAAVSGTTFAVVVGSIAALLFIVLFLFRSLRKISNTEYVMENTSTSTSVVNTALFVKTALAILAARLLLPVTDFIESIIIPNRLMHAGMTSQQATSIFGETIGMASTIVYMPMMITFALAHILTPKLAADWEQKRRWSFARRVNKALTSGWLSGLCSSLFLMLHAREISLVIIGDESITRAIFYLSMIPLIAGLRELTTIILWSAGSKRAPLSGLAAGAVVSTAVNYFVIGIPGFAYVGIALGLFSFECVALIWNFLSIKGTIRNVLGVFTIMKETVFFLIIGCTFFALGNYLVSVWQLSPLIKLVANSIFFLVPSILYIFIRAEKVR